MQMDRKRARDVIDIGSSDDEAPTKQHKTGLFGVSDTEELDVGIDESQLGSNQWMCKRCTYVNTDLSKFQCEICLCTRAIPGPVPPPSVLPPVAAGRPGGGSQAALDIVQQVHAHLKQLERESQLKRERAVKQEEGQMDAIPLSHPTSTQEVLGVIAVPIVGLQYHKGRLKDNDVLSLQREPTNNYDANAIAVLNSEGHMVGHVKALPYAAILAPLLDNGSCEVSAKAPTYLGAASFSTDMEVTVYGSKDNPKLAGLKGWLNNPAFSSMAMVKSEYPAGFEGPLAPEDEDDEEEEEEEMDEISMATFRDAIMAHLGGADKPIDESLALIQGTQTTRLDLGPNEQDIVQKHLEELFSKVQSFEEMPELDPATITKDFTLELYPYQKQGVQWLLDHEKPRSVFECGGFFWRKEESTHLPTVYVHNITQESQRAEPMMCRGGILADEMGLGKTAQMLACMMCNPNEAGDPFEDRGQTLIVCPVTLLKHWEDQICKYASALSVKVYYGGNRNGSKNARKLSTYDVVLTTYGVVGNDWRAADKNPDRITPLHTTEWYRVVLDEGHNIKNRSTFTYKGCHALKASIRWLITATPIQNRLEELYSLLSWLRMEPFTEKRYWTDIIMRYIKRGDKRGLDRLQTIVAHICLKRLKSTVINNKTIVDLPPMRKHLVKVEFSEKERKLYDAIHSQTNRIFNRFVELGTAQHHFVHLLVLVLRLRRLCDHPSLIPRELLHIADKLLALQTQQMEGASESHIQEMSQAELQQMMNILIKAGEELCSICLEELTPSSIMLTNCNHMFCKPCMRQLLVMNPSPPCPLCRATVTKVVEGKAVEEQLAKHNSSTTTTTSSSVDSDETNIENEEEENECTSSSPSSKVNGIMKQLLASKDAETGKIRKTVIFSQWTQMLDVVQCHLQTHQIRYTRLDGSMSLSMRQRQLGAFDQDDGVTVFLISLKAGGVGLNLIAASQVFLIDPWWNPAIDEQAIQRVHRLGQTKDVNVYRFVIAESIEEKILELQDRKLEIIKGAFRGGKPAKMTLDDFHLLLG